MCAECRLALGDGQSSLAEVSYAVCFCLLLRCESGYAAYKVPAVTTPSTPYTCVGRVRRPEVDACLDVPVEVVAIPETQGLLSIRRLPRSSFREASLWGSGDGASHRPAASHAGVLLKPRVSTPQRPPRTRRVRPPPPSDLGLRLPPRGLWEAQRCGLRGSPCKTQERSRRSASGPGWGNGGQFKRSGGQVLDGSS